MTGNVGTVAWIAPEVFQNKKYSEKCDVYPDYSFRPIQYLIASRYSFGVILYEMLTHITPFKDVCDWQQKVIDSLHR